MTAPHTQAPVTVRTFTQRFSATRRGARLARMLAEVEAVAWGIPRGSAAFDALTLVVAELASNSGLHGRVPGRDFELRLLLAPGGSAVRVEVSDTHPRRPEAPPAEHPPVPGEDGGRGLVIVDALALRWGVRDRVGPGKTVWADCPLRLEQPYLH
ncbi:ATP-binding protein [Streptomyces flavochromogenes]|uniref:ATP-binding protein n=1 Tax=Streptomyces flavochromogenes TaxID=68199 RepID=UPI0004C20458|nr:ATP-binding protein [Streptomyces flavochromogenes]